MAGTIWKIVIGILIGTAGAALILELFIPEDPDRPDLAEELLLQSQAMQVQLTGETGRGWQKALADANAGDGAALNDKIDSALFAGNYEAACAAVQLLTSQGLRDRLFAQIADKAVEECSSLAYAAFAVQAMQPCQARANLAKRLATRQRICNEKPKGR